MRIDDTLLLQIASLSRLSLTPEEYQAIKKDVENILTHFEKLSQFDSEAGDFQLNGSSLRTDDITSSLTQEEALGNAAEQENGFFTAPKTF